MHRREKIRSHLLLRRAAVGAAFAAVGVLACAGPTQIVEPGLDLPSGDAQRGRAAFVRLDCVACHRVAGDPDLPTPRKPVPFVLGEGTASRPTDARILSSIVNPHESIRLPHRGEVVTPGGKSRMTDFAEVMKVQELIDLVAYLRRIYDGERSP